MLQLRTSLCVVFGDLFLLYCYKAVLTSGWRREGGPFFIHQMEFSDWSESLRWHFLPFLSTFFFESLVFFHMHLLKNWIFRCHLYHHDSKYWATASHSVFTNLWGRHFYFSQFRDWMGRPKEMKWLSKSHMTTSGKAQTWASLRGLESVFSNPDLFTWEFCLSLAVIP